jgi:precorrin-6B methylase 2
VLQGFDGDEHLGYYMVPYRLIFMILNRLMLGPNDLFPDIGCRRGMVLCCAARYEVAAIIGLDAVAAMAAAARHNLQSSA